MLVRDNGCKRWKSTDKIKQNRSCFKIEVVSRALKISWMLGRRLELRMGRIPRSSEEQRNRKCKHHSLAGTVWCMTVNHSSCSCLTCSDFHRFMDEACPPSGCTKRWKPDKAGTYNYSWTMVIHKEGAIPWKDIRALLRSRKANDKCPQYIKSQRLEKLVQFSLELLRDLM